MPATDGDSKGAQASRSLVRRSLVVVVGGVALLLIVRWVACDLGRVQWEVAAGREFVLSDHPEDVLLQVSSGPGLSGLSHTYRLFGDGRLSMRLVRHDGTLQDGRELYLGRGEIHDLLRNLIESGVVDCDSECYQRRWWAKIGVVPLITDVGETTLTVRLERYRGPDGSNRSDYEHSLTFNGDAVLHREMLERGSRSSFPELDGLADLQTTLHRYRKLANDRP